MDYSLETIARANIESKIPIDGVFDLWDYNKDEI